MLRSQKLEAVGQLTGGVAHDFNNLLQVISGNLQLLTKDVAGNPRAEMRVQSALAGVARGAKLAKQLLAFARRQPLEPKVVNVGRLVQGMDDMLRRALGGEIETETVVAGGLWNTLVDPDQIENAILNLAINARDAMEGQGRLTIEASNAFLDDEYARRHDEVAPGQYVLLAVTDTGVGIPPEALDRVFEPFFTTKPEDKGTGLGLAMVYGLVKQSGGHVKIYSEVGSGTTVKLYLPRAMAGEDALVGTFPVEMSGGDETILVVEDDDEVREVAVSMLGELGYRVFKARDAVSALAIVESGLPIDLIFTDVMMPGAMRSPELARRAKERLPNVAVLFTSGYTENAIVHGGRLDPGVELLAKPYTREALARKIRHVLANQAQRQGAAQGTAKAPAQEALRNATVLLVEDDAFIRSTTAEMLADAGCLVREASSAEEAILILKSTTVDVLLTDVGLPGISGLDLAKTAREFSPDICVVVASGDSGAGSDAAFLPASLVVKPYTPDTLRQTIVKALQVRRHATRQR
ncbi:response regulator [Micromonospora sp. STR1s_5]|nr:response regulator [Micromonospora sp. STR1s_5]